MPREKERGKKITLNHVSVANFGQVFLPRNEFSHLTKQKFGNFLCEDIGLSYNKKKMRKQQEIWKEKLIDSNPSLARSIMTSQKTTKGAKSKRKNIHYWMSIMWVLSNYKRFFAVFSSIAKTYCSHCCLRCKSATFVIKEPSLSNSAFITAKILMPIKPSMCGCLTSVARYAL